MPEQITRIEITLRGSTPIEIIRSNMVASGSVLHDYQPRLRAIFGLLLMDTRKHNDEDLSALEIVSNRGE